ncbi:MAG: hypothetical protein WBA54_10195, partial [Acidaminobacteraceae bacterium]
NNREYIEITEPFSDGQIDSKILTLVTSDSSLSNPSVTNGELMFTGKTRFAITEQLKDYDYIELTIDQPYANSNRWNPYAGVGISAKNSRYSYIEMEYLSRANNGNNKDMKLDFSGIEKFRSYDNINFSTKLIATKKSNGKFDVSIKVYPMGKTTEDDLLVTIDNKNTDFDFENLYLGSFDSQSYDYKLDNLKILAYKTLTEFEVNIKNFEAKTSGTFIKLTWDKPSETFDSYVIKELIDGVVVNEYDNIASTSTEHEISLANTTNYSDRTFEIYAKKDTRYSTKQTTTWQGGIRFLSITNFKASTNGNNILLNWDALDSNLIDKYVIKETTAGHSSTLSLNVNKSTTTYTLPLIPTLMKRTFTIEAFRDDESNKPAQAGWENNTFLDIAITGFTAKASGDKIILTWNMISGNFDNLVVSQVGKSDSSKTLAKGVLTTEFDLGDTTTPRSFTIHAVLGEKKSVDVQTAWSVSQNSMTINQISGHTGKKLGVLVFEGSVGQNIIGDVLFAGYQFEGFNANTITFAIGTTAKTLNAMYIKPNSTVDEASWKAEAFESINRYAATGKIDFYENSYYATRYNTGGQSDAENTNKDLLVDFKRILATAGLTDIRDNNLEAYKIAILAASSYADLEALQFMIDEINGPIDMANKDKKQNGYVDLKDNTKVTAHDFEFGLATEINIKKGSIYEPSFEFELQGNEYLTYKNPTVSLLDSSGKRISSKATIEYDAVNFKYMIGITLAGVEDNMLAKGIYYVNLDTKTEVNTEFHTLDDIIAKNDDVVSKAKIKNKWEFSYFIDQIVIDDKKITDGLSSTMKIKYKTSETSELKVIESEKIKFKIENTKTLPGGF